MLALSIKQPFVEQILNGKKLIEYRTISTKIIGKRFYLYASQTIRTDVRGFSEEVVKPLPRGVIVGTVIISKCTPRKGMKGFEWHLKAPKRLKNPFKPKNKPQPVWFKPF